MQGPPYSIAHWEFTGRRPVGDDSKFRQWCAEHTDLFVVGDRTAPPSAAGRITSRVLNPPYSRPAAVPHPWSRSTRALEDAFSESQTTSAPLSAAGIQFALSTLTRWLCSLAPGIR